MAETKLGAALTDAYRARLDRLRARTQAITERAWGALGSWDAVDASRYAEAVVPVVTAAQQQAAALTSGYLAAFIALEAGVDVGGSVASLPEAPSGRVGVDPVEVYRRPFIVTWTALKEGVAFADALARGSRRASMLASTDIQLAARTSAHQTLASAHKRVVGYRRVLGPGKNCGLCVVASTQRYHREDLLPIHPACGCTVEPLMGTKAPPRVIDRERVSLIRSQLNESDLPYTREALAGLRVDLDDLPDVEVVHHGELGPLLWQQGHAFTEL